MNDIPPPFAALRLLHAACRTRTFRQAGQELGVTHAAVSQAISKLEERYGVPLFRGREPTRAALAFAASYETAIRDLDRTRSEATGVRSETSFVISTLPSLAKLWLAPRLDSLRAKLPNVNLEIRTSRNLADLEMDGVDFAIRFGLGSWPGLHAQLIFREMAYPVASPAFSAAHPRLAEGDFSTVSLLLETPALWPLWFEAVNLPFPETPPGGAVIYDDAAIVIDAAIGGKGIALARRVHVADRIADGSLERVSEFSVGTPQSCYAVWRPERNRSEHVALTLEWFLTECGHSGLLG